MALDNPSYFTLASTTSACLPLEPQPTFATFKKPSNKPFDTISTSSECSSSITRTPPLKKQKRNIFRSVSSTSADSNQELLIQGEPRMSDIAPDLHLPLQLPLPLKSETDSREGSLKQGDRNCMYGSLQQADEDTLMSDEDEEVFLTEDSARYYNFGATSMGGQSGLCDSVGRRRHSIGTFMGRERTVSVASSTRSFKEDFPSTSAATAAISSSRDITDSCQASGRLSGSSSSVTIDEHTLRHGSYPRKRCSKCVVNQFDC